MFLLIINFSYTTISLIRHFNFTHYLLHIFLYNSTAVCNQLIINSLYTIPSSRQVSNVTFKLILEDDGIIEFPLAMRTTGPETGRNFTPAVLERVKSLPRETALRCLSKWKEEEWLLALLKTIAFLSAKLSKQR